MKSYKYVLLIIVIITIGYIIRNMIVDEPPIETSLYESILKGDFSSIEDQDSREYMGYLYTAEMSDEKCNWKYLIHDFNNDGIEELYIKLSDTYDSALFTYKNGYVKWIYIDALEMNCYRFPLNDGRFVEVYDYWTAPTTTVFEFDSDFNWINVVQYIKTDQEEIISNMNEEYGINKDYSSSSQKFRYYYKSSNGEKWGMDEEEWNRIQNYIIEERFYLIDLAEF